MHNNIVFVENEIVCERMNPMFLSKILELTHAEGILKTTHIQSLWSGYGQIQRYILQNGCAPSVIVKHIQFPVSKSRNNLSHQRKVKSYEVEMAWYQKWNLLCTIDCRTPKCFGMYTEGNEMLIVLEDLDAVGFNIRNHHARISEVKICLNWLANFHAIFMNSTPSGIWEKGTYWHLETRPDELKMLNDQMLKKSASNIDFMLSQCEYQSFVHGDAKLANFCFSHSQNEVAAVDFQYVGKGCGMKDVAYLLDSCLSPSECEKYESDLLDFYFDRLTIALQKNQPNILPRKVESEWRPMYKIAYADFYRFLKGWSPGYYDNYYSDKIIKEVLSKLN